MGWGGREQRDVAFTGQRRVLEGQGPHSGGGECWEWVGGGLSVAVTLHKGFFFWQLGLHTGVGKGLGLMGFPCGGHWGGWGEYGLGTSAASHVRGKKKEKTSSKIPFFNVFWGACLCPCVLYSNPAPAALLNPQ